jgi:very-short-patch-repair endonuclease
MMPAPEPKGCLTAILALFGLHLGVSTGAKELPYRQRDDFLSPAEFSFYRVLVSAVGSRAIICPKVNLADVFYVGRSDTKQSHQAYQAYRNKISAKHVDFLICDPTTMRPRLAVELDDSSHGRRDRQERDEFVDRVFEAARLPLLHIPAQAAYNPSALWSQVAPHLEAPAPTQPAMATPTPGNGPPTCPKCPKCDVPMVQRMASKGKAAGQQFFGCRNYPKCREIIRAEP